jgi:hypothetical protein
MSKERNLILNKIIINETVETIIDSIYEKTEHYMFETGRYTETNDEFFEDREEYMIEVINELYNRINN